MKVTGTHFNRIKYYARIARTHLVKSSRYTILRLAVCPGIYILITPSDCMGRDPLNIFLNARPAGNPRKKRLLAGFAAVHEKRKFRRKKRHTACTIWRVRGPPCVFVVVFFFPSFLFLERVNIKNAPPTLAFRVDPNTRDLRTRPGLKCHQFC